MENCVLAVYCITLLIWCQPMIAEELDRNARLLAGPKVFPGAATNTFKDPHCEGKRDVIVHLMEWKWTDIAKECTDFLGPYGFCAVQVSPPNENKVVVHPNRPWWERYQPVSYNLITRSGNATEFKDMVDACNEAGVRIYADVILNHMAADGDGTGFGTGGSPYNATARSYPTVPYSAEDFHDDRSCGTKDGLIHNWKDPEEVRNCHTLGLPDLDHRSENVRSEIFLYLSHLLEAGVYGFRVDGVKFMWPSDIEAMMKDIVNFQGEGRPFVYQDIKEEEQETILATEYLDNGRVTNFKYGAELYRVFSKKNPMKYLHNWGPAWNMWPSGDVVNFLDNHSNQRDGGGFSVLSHWQSKLYKMATAFMLAHPYGMPRVMSSFRYQNAWEGPPHNADMSTKSVSITGHICHDGWVCEHRWRQIYNMVAFRNIAAGSGITNWWSGPSDYQIAFARGNKAFIAFNLDDRTLDERIYTGLPPGKYCNVISGNLSNDTQSCTHYGSSCVSPYVVVEPDGTARIKICPSQDPVVAIHIGAKIGSPPRRV